jgi:hypothetical protein
MDSSPETKRNDLRCEKKIDHLLLVCLHYKKVHLLVKQCLFSELWINIVLMAIRIRLSILKAIQIRIRIWIRILPQVLHILEYPSFFVFLFAAVQVCFIFLASVIGVINFNI